MTITTEKQLYFYFNDGDVCYDAFCFPPDHETGFNWSLAAFHTQEQIDSQPLLAARIDALAQKYAVTRILAPSVFEHSAMIVEATNLTTKLRLPSGIPVYRQKDLPADGVPLKAGEAFMMSAAGCPVAIASGKGMCIPMHASRDSLVDKARIQGQQPIRRFESVIHHAVSVFDDWLIEPKDITLRSCFNIPRQLFTHDYGDPLWRLLREDLVAQYRGRCIMDQRTGALDLPEWMTAIAHKLRIGRVGTGQSLTEGYAHTRLPGDLGKQRNLVFVVRHT